MLNLEDFRNWIGPKLSGSSSETGKDAALVGSFILLALTVGFCAIWPIGYWYGAWWAFGSFATGTIVGFLYGIPHAVQNDSIPKEPKDVGTRVSQRVNTNLEQISDWLTKIIVGFGLIQIQQIPSAIMSVNNYLSFHTKIPASIAGCIITYFAIVGFFAGYLLTRLYLAGAFERADNRPPHQPMDMKIKEFNKIAQMPVSELSSHRNISANADGNVPINNALIIVDVQNDFFRDGALPVKDAESLPLPLNAAIDLAEKHSLKIIYTQDWHPKDHRSFIQNGGSWVPHCVIGTEGANLHPNLRRASTHEIIQFGIAPEADGYTPFENQRMDYLLSTSGVRRVYVTGIALEYCVFATIKEALGRGLKVTAIKSLIRAAEPASADEIWNKLKAMGVDVIEDLSEHQLKQDKENSAVANPSTPSEPA